MPIYEYYCKNCHLILNFFSRGMQVTRQPSCPHCGRKRLQREVSLFSAGRKGQGGGEGGDDDGMGDLPIDERKMERAIEALSSEADRLDSDDPRAAAQLMRKFSDMTGMSYNEGIEQALARMEAGEDPEAIEAEMGDVLNDDDPFVFDGAGKNAKGTKGGQNRGAPGRDETLYDL